MAMLYDEFHDRVVEAFSDWFRHQPWGTKAKLTRKLGFGRNWFEDMSGPKRTKIQLDRLLAVLDEIGWDQSDFFFQILGPPKTKKKIAPEALAAVEHAKKKLAERVG